VSPFSATARNKIDIQVNAAQLDQTSQSTINSTFTSKSWEYLSNQHSAIKRALNAQSRLIRSRYVHFPLLSRARLTSQGIVGGALGSWDYRLWYQCRSCGPWWDVSCTSTRNIRMCSDSCSVIRKCFIAHTLDILSPIEPTIQLLVAQWSTVLQDI